MAWLLLGVGLGMTAVALSEHERENYYVSRSMFDFLGTKDGAEIYRDRVTGEYYMDDGYNVQRIGRRGFTPHPVHRERLRLLYEKYNPVNVRWVDFVLATYDGNEQQCWVDVQNKYVLPPKPKEPTWGKGIRKARWTDYEEQLADWEKEATELNAAFKKECKYWDDKVAKYSPEVQGKDILRRALSGESNVITMNQPSMQAGMQTFQAKIPDGLSPGDDFAVNANGVTVNVKVPAGATPGKFVQFNIPAGGAVPPPPAAAAAAPRPPPPAAVAPPPPAIDYSSSAPPPAIDYSSYTYNPPAAALTAPPPPAIQKKSSGWAPSPATTNYTAPSYAAGTFADPNVPPPAIGS